MKKIFVFGTLFVLVDLLLVCGTILGVMLYDYFNHRELFKIYQSEYGLPLILFLSFTLSTIICAVLFGVGYALKKMFPSIRDSKIWAWVKKNMREYDNRNFTHSSSHGSNLISDPTYSNLNANIWHNDSLL